MNYNCKSEAYTESIDTMALLKAYDDVLIGKREAFPIELISKESAPYVCASLLRLIFRKYLGWTPAQVRDLLTPKVVERMCLAPLVSRIPSPPEVLRDSELYFVAWYLYPEMKNSTDAELVGKVYQDLITGKIRKFPRNYFEGGIGHSKAKYMFVIMLQEYYNGVFESVEAMYRFFASAEGEKAVEEHKLKQPMKMWYDSALDYFHDSIPSNMKTEKTDCLYRCIKVSNNPDIEPIGNFLSLSDDFETCGGNDDILVKDISDELCGKENAEGEVVFA